MADRRRARRPGDRREAKRPRRPDRSTRQAPADYDGDGINDSADKCPTRPETKNGFQDADGCPDVVETTGAS
ncbi:thrombospondin type 3 repeat-containing protein [Halomicroarcula sp. GCM10025894]|uniref:thrombospondin type 3 repeat-containing protein n=1 Tax=Halomicroarcula sp. GCM10025894 TaxID=3252673 RepID=UPI00361D5654